MICCTVKLSVLVLVSLDFDEETADDKDIDMGAYYGHSEGNDVKSTLSCVPYLVWLVL